MLPSYETRCHRQERDFDGADLAKKRRTQIFARAPEISADAIQCLGHERFNVQSASDPSKIYSVDLGKDSSSDLSKLYLIDHGKDVCDCLDWPRARLCKHIAAIAHFRTDGTAIQPTQAVPEPVPQEHESPPDWHESPASDASAVPILENLISVSRDFLSDGPPSSPGTVRSLRIVESHLTAVIQNSRASQSPLPDRESLPPNQRTWTETAERMGVKRRKRPHPTSSSPIPAVPATDRIGKLNRKQPRMKNPDPYSGGLRSGKDAAPDAQTTEQNADARARAATDPSEPLPSQPTKRRRKRAATPPPPPSSAPLQGTSAPPPPFAWYPTHAAYPSVAYSQVPHYGAAPLFWPYGHLPPSQPYQPYYPNTQ
jgi:hypothetical protein